jgi:hypothetical protein
MVMKRKQRTILTTQLKNSKKNKKDENVNETKKVVKCSKSKESPMVCM